ncbi:MAG: ABC transporter permease subunit [Deltaproteobacteria bacterium]|nr:ABC transporter permease subunit [Deltaproteobacteria bacterium]
MVRSVLQRLIGSLLVIWVIVTASFFLMRLAPGGPFDQERTLPVDVLKNIEAKYHLDESVWKQYLLYTQDIVLRGDLGPSYKYSDRSVNDFIKEGLPVTLTLGFFALLVALTIGISTGLLAALRHNSRWDYAAMGFAVVGISVPNFVIGPLLQLFFGIKLQWLPVAGWSGLPSYVLPSITLGTIYAASIARLTRGGMLEVTRQDYIRTARAKGLPERLVIFRHMIRGGLLPVITYLGPAVAFLFFGSLVVEKIFNIFFSALILVCNLMVDVLYAVIDPRLRR